MTAASGRGKKKYTYGRGKAEKAFAKIGSL